MTMVVLWWKFFGEETMAFSLQKCLSVVPLKKYKEQFKCILSLSLRQSSSSMPCMSCNVCCISGSILSHHEWTCQCQPLDTNFVTSSKLMMCHSSGIEICFPLIHYNKSSEILWGNVVLKKMIPLNPNKLSFCLARYLLPLCIRVSFASSVQELTSFSKGS